MFQVNIRDKKNGKILRVEYVNSESFEGILLKAKLQALNDGFKFDKKKHLIGFIPVN